MDFQNESRFQDLTTLGPKTTWFADPWPTDGIGGDGDDPSGSPLILIYFSLFNIE